MRNYIGRFAPSPTGPLHAGSLVAAMASYLDAKVHHGEWLVRIEDIDAVRTVPGATNDILHTLLALGMQWDGDVVLQSTRNKLYETAAAGLRQHVFDCGCTRREIADSRIGIASDGAAIYPGTCRDGIATGKIARTSRLRVPDIGDAGECIAFDDRQLGAVSQHLAREVGDFVLHRADGFWSYQLAVVVDDAEQQVTDVVRGIDLLDSTARQIYLQRLLGAPTPRYLHVPVVTNDIGEKLSKQTGAVAVDRAQPLRELSAAAQFIGLHVGDVQTIENFWSIAMLQWAIQFNMDAGIAG